MCISVETTAIGDGMSIKKNGSELRARLIQVYLDHGKRCWDPEVCVDEPTNTDEWKGCSGHIVDKMLGEIQDRMMVAV